MKTHHKLDKTFGSAGSSAGYFILTVGLVAVWFSIAALALIILGAFMGLSFTGSTVDHENKQIRFYNCIFGFWKIGKWTKLNPDMKAGIKKSSQTWRTFSRSNRSTDIVTSDFRIVLFDSRGKEISELIKTSSHEEADMELEKLQKLIS